MAHAKQKNQLSKSPLPPSGETRSNNSMSCISSFFSPPIYIPGLRVPKRQRTWRANGLSLILDPFNGGTVRVVRL
jgi:hypothetical protein